MQKIIPSSPPSKRYWRCAMTEKIIPIASENAPAAGEYKSLIPDEETASRAVLPFPNSSRIYVKGSRVDIEVPMRAVKLSPTLRLDGSQECNPDVFVYDTSGDFGDPQKTVDIRKGLCNTYRRRNIHINIA